MKQSQIIITILMAIAVITQQAGTAQGAAEQGIYEENIQTAALPHYMGGEILVRFKPGTNLVTMEKINKKHGTSILAHSRFTATKRLRIPPGKTVEEMVAIYSHNPNVLYAEPNFIAYATFVPNDPLFPYQWHLDNDDYGGIRMIKAWDMEPEPGGASLVTVAVIDTGVAYQDYIDYVQIGGSGKEKAVASYAQAPDLAGINFLPGYDFVNNDEHPNDDDGHGTHVTGTIAQSTNNGIGVAGIAYKVSIMPIKVLDNTGSGTYFDVADGIYFASANGAQIINMSLGGSSPSETLELALKTTYEKGVTIVCASGNNGSDNTLIYPAAYDQYCIAVGATRYDEAVSYYSNKGPSLDLTAPGGDTTVDQNGDGYGDGILQQTFVGSDYTDFHYYFFQGTSMATPHVSGVAALLISHGVAVTPDNIREVLQTTTEDHGGAGWDSAYGWGIVDAAAALAYTPAANTPPIANPGGPYSGTEDKQILFDGSGSQDPDGDDLTYAWDFGDGSIGTGATPVHTYSAGGTYQVTLTVHDGKVNSLPITTTATIEDINDAPVADAGPDLSTSVDEPVVFDGSGSYDEEKNTLSYSWDFGDGSAGASDEEVTHSFKAPGLYTVTLTVSDYLLSDTDTAQVEITETTDQAIQLESINLSLKYAGTNVS
ncbi:MAG: S8 family serine peptidase, partial [Desulfobulbaceae bacterium]|nr:S8 family serine peptidase [Desulfobulbaceae bacterium]